VEHLTDRASNPFGMSPDCESYVPGYGDPNADFHVIGDHPAAHGGVETGVPFTEAPASERLQAALVDGGLLETAGDEPEVASTFLSYLHLCVPAGDGPTEVEYGDMERFVDAEVRAIAAHVLLPVGERATRFVLETYTARPPKDDLDVAALHGTEIRGAGWLVVPIRDPREWDDEDGDRLAGALQELRATDYRRVSDLGRFLPGGDPYLVR
jgi:uracil-DNA glycosylase